MYSDEERLRAVELYIRLGKNSRAAIRQLGYPTKNSLRGWHQEFLERGELHIAYARLREKYSVEQKNAAIEHYMNQGRCFSATLKALGYPGRGTLVEWVRERYPETRKCVIGKTGRPSASLASKQVGVYELCMREGSAQEVAQRQDVSRVTLYNWKNQLLGQEACASMKREKYPPAGTERMELERQVESLQRDIRNLQLEHDLLKKANEILKKELGVSLQLLSNREKTMLVDALREKYVLPDLLDCLGLARSSYFYQRSRMGVADKYAEVRRTITDIFESNHQSYGYRRIQASLNRQRIFVSETVVQRLMKQEHLQAARPKRRRYHS